MGQFQVLFRGLKNVIDFVNSLTVEPIAFLVFLSLNLYQVAHQAGVYQTICVQLFPENVNYIPENSLAQVQNPGHAGSHRHADLELESWKVRSPKSSDPGNATNDGGGGGPRVYSSVANEQVVNCDHLEFSPDAESTIQEQIATFNLVESLTHIIPMLLAHVVFGALGDKYGRKTNLLIGITGTLINTLPFVILLEYNFTPLLVLIVVSFLTSFTGMTGTVMMSSFAYLADTIVEKEQLTVRMTIYAVVMSASGMVGSGLAASVVDYLKLSYVGLLQMASLTIAFFYAIVRLKQLSPAEMKKRMKEKEVNKVSNGQAESVEMEPPSNSGPSPKPEARKKENVENRVFCKREQSPKVKLTKIERLKKLLSETWQMVVEVYRTYAKPRPHRHRVHLLLVALVFFLDLLSNMALHMNSIYVFRSPISWKAKQLALWKTVGNALHFCANLVGIVLFKKLFKFRETTIMLLALTSHMAQELIMGFANSGWLLYFSTCVGCLSPLFMPCVKSFVTQIVDADEVGKSFIMFGLANDIGRATSSVASNAIYRATVRFFPGFIYIFCSGILGVSLIVLLFVHVDSKRLTRSINTPETDPNI